MTHPVCTCGHGHQGGSAGQHDTGSRAIAMWWRGAAHDLERSTKPIAGWACSTNEFNWHTIEGPCAVKHDGKYYCFYSGANWQTPRYGEDYVVADSPLGPYSGAGDHARVLHGIPGQVFGPGGATITTGPDGKTQYIVYHAWNKQMTERQLCIDKLEWTPDGPSATPTTIPQPMAQPMTQ